MKLPHSFALLAVLLCSAATARAAQDAPAGVTGLDLDGRWTLRQDGKDQAIPATVPGTVHTDLLAAGKIPDPFYGKNEDDLQWVGQTPWTYSRDFDVDAALLERGHVVLRCDGLDTAASVTLNGQKLGDADNMFRTWEFDAKPLLKAGRNTITIAFTPVPTYVEQQIAAAKRDLTGPATWYGGMSMIRKPVYSEGWDFGPRFYTMGIWKPIRLVAWDAARLTHVSVDQNLKGDLAANEPAGTDLSVTAHADIDPSAKGLTAAVTVSLDGQEVASGQASLIVESTQLSLTIDKPQLWWPAGMGKHPLYDVTVEVKDAGGAIIDRSAQRVGLRRIELLPKTDDRPLRLRVNGKEIFARGASWIPSDMFAPRESREHIRDLIAQAAGANFNFLRVWGGGYYPGEDFFDACDENGLLVWMDFAFACKGYPIGNPGWADNVRHEVVDVVRRLRGHPSMAVWCGNNEVEAIVKNYGVMGQEDYDKLFHKLIGETVEQEYPRRPVRRRQPGGRRRAQLVGLAHRRGLREVPREPRLDDRVRLPKLPRPRDGRKLLDARRPRLGAGRRDEVPPEQRQQARQRDDPRTNGQILPAGEGLRLDAVAQPDQPGDGHERRHRALAQRLAQEQRVVRVAVR